jgi:hypothetical protein
MSQNVLLRAKGLYTYPNLLSEAPQGSLVQAHNVVINKDGVIESRRGFKLYGDVMTSNAKQLLTYKNRILRYFGNTLQFDDGNGTYTSFSGTYSEAQDGLRIKGVEANGNLYFTTSDGIKKISASDSSTLGSATVTNSGGVKALDTKLSLNSQSGFFSQESTIAYRIVWGIKDANNNLILGYPSERAVIVNPLTDLLITDFNNLLTLLDTVNTPGGISDGNYHSSLSVSVNSPASTLRTSLIALTTKLDNDTVITEGAINTANRFKPTTSSAKIQFNQNVSTFLQVGDKISISGLGDTELNGTFTILSVTTTTLTNDSVTFAGTFTSPYAGPTADTAGVVTRKKYTNITQPVALSQVPTSGELTSMQEYYDAIVEDLQVEPSGIVPSATIFNNSGSTQSATVNLSFTIPSNITTAHFYQIYRTALSTSTDASTLSDLDPGDEMGLVFEDNPTSSEITAGSITVQDITPDSFRGANLYTNPNSGEGIAQANEVPPFAKDIALFKNCLMYANTKTKQRKQLSLLSVVDLVADTSTFSISNGTTTRTYTFSTVEDDVNRKVLISTLDTPAQQVDETARSLVHVINLDPNGIVYAYYLSGPTDVPGLILFESKSLADNAFHFTVNNTTTGQEFSPTLPTSGSTVISDNEVVANRIYYSKKDQPEAVPLLNYFDVGPRDKKILRIVALRDSLFVFKEEGIYRVSGDVAPFVLNLFDSSTILTAPDSAAVLNNQIYLLSDQGVATVSDTGVSIISRPIEGDLLKLNTPTYPNYKTASFGCSYESDRSYYLWTVSNPSDTKATQCLRYNTFTNSWTNIDKAVSCAVINTADDKMYLGANDVNYIEQERKSFDRTDYADREFSVTIGPDSINDTIISFPTVNNVEARDVIIQTQYLTIAQFNRLLIKLDNDIGVNDSDYFTTLQAMAGNDLRTKLNDLATKLDNDTGVADSDYLSSISGYSTSLIDQQSAFNVIVNKLNADTGVSFFNYLTSTGTSSYEVVIADVDTSTNKVTTLFAYPFVPGPLTIYKHIDTIVQWAPQTFGDPSMMKQVSEATIIFDKNNFSEASVAYASDLEPGFDVINFNGSGNGSFGYADALYGANNYGGEGNSIPIRTYIPRNKQRCRYIHCRFEHSTARETFAIYGLSLTSNPTSTRAYR